MNNKTMTSAEAILRDRKKRGARNALLLCLAILVVAGVVGVFHLPATAKTYQKWVLTCPAEAPAGPGYAGFFLHTHNDDCFDESWNLVCPLPEIKAHVHDEHCYNVLQELNCAIPESDGHRHTPECYTRVRGDLTCTLSTEPVLDEEGNVLEEGHVHTDACYAWHEELTCGMAEGEGAHHHDESCYRTVTTLTCDRPELIPHVHTDACLQKNEDGSIYVDESGNTWLTCGMQELTEHVHGPECFTVYELDDGEPEETGETYIVTTESETGNEIVTETEIETETETGIGTEEEIPASVVPETAAAENTEEAEDSFVFLYPEEDETEAETGETAAEEKQEDGSTEGDAENSAESDSVIGGEDTEPSDNTAETETADEKTDAEGEETAEEDKEEEEPADKQTNEDEQEEETQESEETPEVIPTRQIGSEKGGATVLAEVPENILGENARLSLNDYSADAAKAAILSAVNENAAEGEEREITALYVIDIGLTVNGEPVIPEGETQIRFTLRTKEIRGMSAPKVYQLINGTAEWIKEADFDLEAGTVSFMASGFSAFAIVDLTGEDPVDEEPEETPVSVSMPAQTFEADAAGVVVTVDAPEGAFPAGTTMVVSPVEMDDDTLSNVTGAVESSGEKKVVTAQAVDISFFDAEQNLIEPKLPIKVSMKSAIVSESENVALVHLTETDTAKTVENETPENEASEAPVVPAAPVAEVVTDVQVVENPDEDNEIQFESDAFSVYVLVGTETITTNYITANGETYTIKVTYDTEAGIPEGAQLQVSEIIPAAAADDESEPFAEADAYSEYIAKAEEALPLNQRVTFARFFDITILADGEKIEPLKPVEVTIELADEMTAEEFKAVHFVPDANEEGTTAPVLLDTAGVETTMENMTNAVSFSADGFSVYGIVGTSLITEITLPGSDETYEVTVTYGVDANLPKNVHLEVIAFDVNSPEYSEAKEAVIATKKAEDEGFDENSLGFAALDISIVSDETGEKLEPAEGAEVKVSIKIKTLPENIDEADLADSLEIQHLNESTGTPKIETVASAADVNVNEGSAEAEFTVDSFSTFTISWNNVSNSTTNLRLRNGNNTRGQVTFNYVNDGGAAITRPSGVGGNTDINNVDTWPNNYEVIISADNVARTITDRTYERAYIIDNGVQKDVTRLLFSRTGNNTWRTAYYNGDTLVTTASGNDVTGNWRIPVYLQYSSLPNEGNTSTIHYGYMEGTTFVEFSQDDLPPTPVEIDSSGSTHFAYLIYDFDGYHYADETYYHSSATTTPGTDGKRTQPLLRWSGSGSKWTYTSSGDLHTYHNSGNQSDVANGSHIYVIYEQNSDIAQGGTPKVRPVNPEDEPEAPILTKNSLNNGDGTNTISLGITGSTTEMEVEKLADVIVVFDVSTSMNLNLNGSGSYGSGAYNINGSNRIANAGRAVESLANSLLEKKNSNGDPLVRMALVPFSMTASIHSFNGSAFTSDIEEFNAAVEGLKLSSGTNWEDALMKANQLSVDPERATFVIFVTDGEPSMRVSRGSYTDAQIGSEHGNAAEYLARTTFYGGLSSNNTKNYDLAVPAATAIVGSNKNLYTIGVSTDVSTLTQLTVSSGAGADHSKTAADEDELIQAFNDIEASIIALLGAGDVQITDGITSLTNLEAKVLETADPTSFKYYRYGGWKTSTAGGQTGTTKDKYGADYEHKTEWTTRETDGCAAAEYDVATSSVKWNMGKNFQLEDGVTYVLEFRVWPSQAAYDLIANLNNGTKEYRLKTDESDAKGLTQEEYDQIDYNETTGFTLKTNTDEVGATYKLSTKTGSTVTYKDEAEEKPVLYEEGDLEPMALMSELITVKKEWAHEFNESHAGDQVKFFLRVGDGYYQNDGTVSTSEANADTLVLSNPDWSASVYIAPGMIDYVNGTVHVLETGHEYALYEYEITQTDSTDNYIASYDFVSQVVRPMRVNGVLKFLVKYTSTNEIPAGVTETYTIDGNTYYVSPGSGDSGILSGTNYRRAEMDITKIINKGTSAMTEEQLNKEVFTYRVTLKIPADADLSLITGWQFVYRPDDPNWTIQGYQEGDSPLPGDGTRFAGDNFRWGTFNYNGTAIGAAVAPDSDPDYVTITMDLSMYPNQVLRLTNLPMGTEYTIEEVYANNRTLASNGLMSNASVVPTTDVASNLAAQGYTQISSASKYGTASGTLISGTIDTPNQRYYNQFTNTMDNLASADFQVTKQLNGYAWSDERYYFTLEAGAHTDASGNEAGTSPMPAGSTGTTNTKFVSAASGDSDVSYSFGTVKYSEAGTYTYTLKEARYRAGGSTNVVDIDQTADTIPGTNIVFEKPVTITVTVSKNADDSLYIEKVEGARTELSRPIINTIFTNSQPCYVKILKVGDSTIPLSDVQFKVYSDSDLTTLVAQDAKGEAVGTDGVITTDNDGYAALGAMVSGTTYYLVETETADGYNSLSQPVVITFNGTNVTVSCEQTGIVYPGNPNWLYKDKDGTWIVKINNSSGYELPQTGGEGTLHLRYLGMTVMLGAALLLMARQRQKRES